MPESAVMSVDPTSQTESISSADQLEQLRALLLGSDYQVLLDLRQHLLDNEGYSIHVAGVISEALTLRSRQDDSLSAALSPTVEEALGRSVERDPDRLANALYPVMGPAIRKSINEVLTQTLETFNQLLEQSLSPRSLRWRFDAWRTGRSYPEVVLMKTLVYQVEQVFLIHRESGLLLQHVVSPQAITKDPDMVSGMLTAIQDFIRDSFAVSGEDALDNLRLGDLTVLVKQGPYAVLAAVVRGNPPASLRVLLETTQEDIHRQMSHSLKTYQGDNAPFERVQPLLERCLAVQLQERKKRAPWLAWLVLLALLGALAWWGYQQYLHHQDGVQALASLRAEPGLVVLGAEKTADGYRYEILRDPLAREPATVLPARREGGAVVEVVSRPYLAMEPDFVLARARRMLQPPPMVSLGLQGGRLLVSGKADVSWQRKLESSWQFMAGVDDLDASQLQVGDADAAQIAARLQGLEQAVESARFDFPAGSSELGDASGHAKDMLQLIRDLVATARQAGQMVQVSVSGATDETGTPATNGRLAKERAFAMHSYLLGQGVPASVLVVTNPDSGVRNERGVRYTVDMY